MSAPNSNERLNAYRIIETIGEGATSKVKLVEEIATKKKYAMKIMKPRPDIQKQIDREIEILRSIATIGNDECPYLVNLHELIITEKRIILVLNYVSGGDLEEKITSSPNGFLNESEAHFYFSELLDALSFLHSKNITHRDLKLENLLIDSDGNLRLSDFGLSIISETDLSTHCGTPYYVAPEVFFNAKYNGPSADIWSCGIVLYMMLCGTFPFEGKNFEELGRKVMKGKVVYPDHLSHDVVDLLSHILNVDIDQRYTIEQIKNHRWFKTTPDVKPLKPTEIDTFDNLLIDLDTDTNNHHPNFETPKSIKKNRMSLIDSSSSDFYIYDHNKNESDSDFANNDSGSKDNPKDLDTKNKSNGPKKQEPEKTPQRLSSSSTTNTSNNELKENKNNSSSSYSTDIINNSNVKNQKNAEFRTVKSKKLPPPRPLVPMQAKTLRMKSKSANPFRNVKANQKDSLISLIKKESGIYLFELPEPVSDACQDTFDFLQLKKARFVDCLDISHNSENHAKIDVKVKMSLFAKLKFFVEISDEGDSKDTSHIMVSLKKGRKSNFKRFLGMMNTSFQESISSRK